MKRNILIAALCAINALSLAGSTAVGEKFEKWVNGFSMNPHNRFTAQGLLFITHNSGGIILRDAAEAMGLKERPFNNDNSITFADLRQSSPWSAQQEEALQQKLLTKLVKDIKDRYPQLTQNSEYHAQVVAYLKGTAWRRTVPTVDRDPVLLNTLLAALHQVAPKN